MSAGADIFARLIGPIWRAALLRRAGLWVAGALPWLLLRSGPGLLAWSAFCAWDGLRLQRRVAHGWVAWLDGALPEMEDSAALLLHAGSPVAQLQRQRLLVGRQHMDRVVGAVHERRHRAGGMRQAPQHQRRRQRHRVEGIGGEPDRHVFRRAGGDDGDAGGEHAERTAEFRCGERRGAGLERRGCG